MSPKKHSASFKKQIQFLAVLNNMKTLKTILIFFSIFLLKSNQVWSQKLIADSLILDLKCALPDSQQNTASIDTVLDIRNIKDPRLIGISEITHFGIVPVDYHIKAHKPLNQIIQDVLPFRNSTKASSLSLGLKHFEFSNQSQFWLFEKYRLKALLEIYNRVNADSLVPVGELIFNSGSTDFFINAKLKQGYEKVFGIWCQELVENLELVSLNFKNTQNPLPYNFRLFRSRSPWMQLYTGADFIYFQNGFLIDAYLTFTYPETKRLFNKSATVLRFRQEKKFDSIEYGLINSSLNYRLNSHFILRFKYDLFLGINRWKDMNVTKHKAYDILIGDLSFSQSFLFFPIHKKTLFWGIGLFQNVYYVYSKVFQFQPGLIINVGMQL